MRQFAFLLLIALPSLLYLIYAAVQRRRAKAAGQEAPPPLLHDTPWLWLLLAGALLFAAALISWALFAGAPPDSTYYPARDENGVIVPGRFDTTPSESE